MLYRHCNALYRYSNKLYQYSIELYLYGNELYFEIEIFTTGSVPFDAGSYLEAWEIKIYTSSSVPFHAGNYVVAWEIENLQQEEFLWLREAFSSRRNLSSENVLGASAKYWY